MYADWWSKLRGLRPDIVVFNMGLHWLHFYGHSSSNHGVTHLTRKGPQLCAVQAWLKYQEFLNSSIEAAAAAGATQIYAKTTNFVCAEKFVGSYASASAAFSSPDPAVKAATISDCVHSLMADVNGGPAWAYDRQTSPPLLSQLTLQSMEKPVQQRIRKACLERLIKLKRSTAVEFCPPDPSATKNPETQLTSMPPQARSALTTAHALAYCRHGVFDNTGASFLNSRLEKVFTDRDSSGAGEDHAYAFKKGAANVVLFNDTAIQACRYTGASDGRHYHPLNTVRIRLLANLIVHTSGIRNPPGTGLPVTPAGERTSRWHVHLAMLFILLFVVFKAIPSLEDKCCRQRQRERQQLAPVEP